MSDIEGKLLGGIDASQALVALHPGGSVTGAPKHAAMQMIATLETTPRGPYTGALGFCSSEGKATFSLLIRTATRTATGWVYGVGGGIVWDSRAIDELREIQVKLGALR